MQQMCAAGNENARSDQTALLACTGSSHKHFKRNHKKSNALLLDSRLSSLCGPAMTACCERWRRWLDPLSVLTRPRCTDGSPASVRAAGVSLCHDAKDQARRKQSRQNGRGSAVPFHAIAALRQTRDGYHWTSTCCQLGPSAGFAYRAAVRAPKQGVTQKDATHRTAISLAAVGGTLSAGALLMPLLLRLLVQFFPAVAKVQCQQYH
jgi:hypothetical protein